MLEIYADILFLQNMALDYTILTLAARISGTSVSALRLLSGSVTGAIASFIYLMLISYFKIPAPVIVLFLIITLFLIAFACFGIKSFRIFTRQILSIIVVSFAIGGMSLIWKTGIQGDVRPVNGVYFLPETIWWDVCWICVIAYAVLRLFSEEVISRLLCHKAYKKVRVVLGGKETILDGFVDTGNMLREPLSGAPVALADVNSLTSILPSLKTGDIFSLASQLGEDGIESRICIIPFKTASNEKGVFTGFRPDFLEVEGRGVVPGAVVGISNGRLSEDGSFNVIIGSSMV